MELAKLELKIGGNPNNTVIKKDVTPGQLAIYAFMHGQDCVQSLVVTGVAKDRVILDEMNRLKVIFTTKDAGDALNTLFPGMAPQLPVSFKSIGYDPDFLSDIANSNPAMAVPKPNNASAASIAKKIKAETDRKVAEDGATTSPVSSEELAAAVTDVGSLELGDDPLEQELANLAKEGQQ